MFIDNTYIFIETEESILFIVQEPPAPLNAQKPTPRSGFFLF